MARQRSRARDAAIAADAQLGPDRVAAVLSRLQGTTGFPARDLLASARVSARHAVDLQRSGLHPARVHHRGRRGRVVRDADGRAARRRSRRRRCCSIRRRALRPLIAPTEHDPWRGRRWSARSTTRTAGRSAARQVTRDCLEPRPPSAISRGRCSRRSTGGASRVAQPATLRDVRHACSHVSGSRALGWDTMLPTSSCGTKMSSGAFGHTGFTGTTLWIDPERGVYVVFFTNRVNPTRENTAIQQIRPALHDAVLAGLTA